MKQKELAKTFMMNSNWKKNFPSFIQKHFSLRVKPNHVDISQQTRHIHPMLGRLRRGSNLGLTLGGCVVFVSSKYDILNQCWVDVGPPSATSATSVQHQPNIGSMHRVNAGLRSCLKTRIFY